MSSITHLGQVTLSITGAQHQKDVASLIRAGVYPRYFKDITINLEHFSIAGTYHIGIACLKNLGFVQPACIIDIEREIGRNQWNLSGPINMVFGSRLVRKMTTNKNLARVLEEKKDVLLHMSPNNNVVPRVLLSLEKTPGHTCSIRAMQHHTHIRYPPQTTFIVVKQVA